MIPVSVIITFLIGAVITGAVPIIAGIVLLAAKKIKGSSFWAGVLAYIVGLFTASLFAGIITVPFAQKLLTDPDLMNKLEIISQVFIFVFLTLAMGFCISVCMKQTRTFKGGISCGYGVGIGYILTSAFGFVNSYLFFKMINSGEFDRQYKTLIDQNIMTKEQAAEAKKVFTDLSVSDGIMQLAGAIGIGLALTAAGVFIMRGVCAKNTFYGIIISIILTTADGLSTLIPNVIAASVIPLAIGAAAMIFAFRMKNDVVKEDIPPEKDDFLTSVENSRNEK